MNISLLRFTFLAAALAAAIQLPAADLSPENEAAQLAILRSNAPAAEKALACKRLAIDGSKTAVPDLAKLLPDPQLSSWARIAIEAIPGAEADAALREAAKSLEGRLLVGAINSIGVRRDAGAVEVLSSRLTDKDPEVASAAAVALGRIGDSVATKALQGQLAGAPAKVRSAVAEGLILCAESLLAAGKGTDAAAIYDEVRKAELPKQRVLEATRGAILARQEAGLPILLEELRSTDKQRFYIALSTAREFKGSEIDKALVAELAKVSAERAPAVVTTLADRAGKDALPAIRDAAAKGAKPVRLAALVALAKVGDETCLATLLDSAVDSDADISAAAKTTLGDLPGKSVDAQIVERLEKADAKQFPILIGLVGQRRIDAISTLVKALDNPDKTVRYAALTAVGETVDLPRMSILITRVVNRKDEDDWTYSATALKAAAVRMPDRDACAAQLVSAIEKSSGLTKIYFVDLLGEVGGATALKSLAAVAKSEDVALQDAGSRVLGKWNGVDAAPVLLDLAKTAPAPQFRTRALRGYIGLARKFAMPETQRAEMCQAALDLSRPAEQKLVLDVMKLHPSKEGLAIAIGLMKSLDLREDASQATLVIAQKLSSKGTDVSDLIAKAGFEKVKLEIVKAEYGAGSTQRDVTAIVRKQAGDLPLIHLPGASYNASFGGDPAPSTVKQLKIQYRLNGKLGEAAFAEDSLIVLPTPK